MIRKLSVSAAALAALGLAAPAVAQTNLYGSPATVDIDVVVQNIAILTVTDPSAIAIVDSSGDLFMPNPSSLGSDMTNFASVRLQTNFEVDALQVDFPRMNGIRNQSSATWFGRAECSAPSACGDTTAIGVWPQIGQISGGSTSGQALWSHSGGNVALVAEGPHREDCQILNICGFPNGTHDMALGVAANWDRTLTGEPQFASPGTYEITLTTTIVPSL